jgi:hypothetical protein
MLEVLRNIWLNYGWSHPWLSSLAAAVFGLSAWWIFGGLIALSTQDSQPTSKSASPVNPANVQQSAVASGGSTINQAGRDVIINMGISEGTMKNLLRDKAIAANQELSQKYPFGYLLFGVANGEVVFQPDPATGLRFNPNNTALITIDSVQRRATVTFPFFEFTFPNNSTVSWVDVAYAFDYVENEPSLFNIGFKMQETAPAISPEISPYIEVLDASKVIFLLGFKRD